ncbi:MAG: hypothetical protein IT544_02285 [Rhodobacteraceae bacterium]|jgi:hypothetical protein|nr:hypothetical protein [Paracoccaceae bacterium]
MYAIFKHSEQKVGILCIPPDTKDQAAYATEVLSGSVWRIVDELPTVGQDRWRWTDSGPLEIAAEVVPVPNEVSRFQARAALITYGDKIARPNLLQETDTLVAGLTAGQYNLSALQVAVIKEAWMTAQVIRRDSAALNLIFPALGLSVPEQRDAILVIAGGVTV